MTLLFLDIVLVLGHSLPAHAQYGYERYTVNSGLPQNEVRGITQTPDGYLWIATMDGLARFDGVRFTIYTKSNSPGINSNRFTSIEQGHDGDLWIAYENGGVVRYHHGLFRSYGSQDGLPGNSASAITTDDAGHVWVLSDGRIALWSETANRFALAQGLNVRLYGPLVWDSSGFVAFDRDRVYCFSKGVLHTYLLPPRLRGATIVRVGLDQRNVAWIRTQSGDLITLADNLSNLQQVPTPPKVIYSSIDGAAWEFQPTDGVMRSIEILSAGKRLNVEFRHALADRQGNLWLATEGQGLYRLQKQTVNTYTVEQGLLDRDVYPVYQDRSGAVWIGTWHKGLSMFQNNRFKNFTVAEGLPSSLVTALCEDRDGQLWIGTHGGLTKFRNGHFDSTSVPRLTEPIQAILPGHDGTLWFGMHSGAASLKDGFLHFLSSNDGPAPRDVHVIAETASGDLWFGGINGLSLLHEGHVTQNHDIGSSNIWSLYPDPDGTLWIGTYDDGLIRLKDGHATRYTTRNGLFNDGVFQILDDRLGNLWISCNIGIYRVSKSELNEVANGARKSIASVAYGSADGLLDLEANGGTMPAGTRTKDGRLWFPTQDGVAVIDPSTAQRESSISNVVVESALVDQVPVSLDAGIRIPPTKYTLEIQYTAPDFRRPNQIRFRYKLDGLDQDWTEAGNRRSASYTHLPPGHYTFLVSAENGNDAWSPSTHGLSIEVSAPFYKTRWFEALILLTIASIVLVIWHYRSLQLKTQQALQLNFLQQLISSQESERKRIAGELHDSLGQRLVIINGIAKLALGPRGGHLNPEEESNALEEISSEALAAIQDTRAISYDLRPVHLDRLGLTRAIEHLVKKAATASDISFSSVLDNVDDLLPEDQRINLFRIVQEAIGNIVKYSSATAASVHVARSEERTVLTIQDDGVGFEVDRNVNKSGRIGMGLRGMAERATLIGGDFRVRARPGEGTTVIVEIPTHHRQSIVH